MNTQSCVITSIIMIIWMDAHNIIGVHLYKKYTKNVFLIG